MVNPIKAIRTIYSETVAELKKCTWPTRKELYKNTTAVLAGLVILTVTVMVLDKIFQLGVGYISGMN